MPFAYFWPTPYLPTRKKFCHILVMIGFQLCLKSRRAPACKLGHQVAVVHIYVGPPTHLHTPTHPLNNHSFHANLIEGVRVCLKGTLRMSGKYPKDVWRMSEECLECDCKVFEGCLAGV